MEQLGLPHQQKEKLYTLVSILGEPVPYKEGIINLKTSPVQVIIKRYNIEVNFNILPLGQDKAILGII